jgi:hypothetical protein
MSVQSSSHVALSPLVSQILAGVEVAVSALELAVCVAAVAGDVVAASRTTLPTADPG